MLYICATPIGNLEDVTARVLRALGEADLIAAEDTRRTRRLLSRFDIHTPLTSYHEHNRFKKAEVLVEKLKEGKDIALVSDAGVPVISDPGEVLIRRCIEEGIGITSLPGANAALTAVTLSGIPSARFAFEGFLPTKHEKKARLKRLEAIAKEDRTLVLYEAPHRLKETLGDLCDTIGGERRVAVCRELTKVHEEVLRCTLSEASFFYREKEPKGEFVLVIEGRPFREIQEEEADAWAELSVREHVAMYENKGLTRMEAMKKAAKERGMTKREVYDRYHAHSDERPATKM